MPTVREHYGMNAVAEWKVDFPGRTSVPLAYVPSQEIIGIEVEVENVKFKVDTLNTVWTMTEDGSLRNRGREFITRPMRAHHAPVVLEHLLNEVLDQVCSFTPRTSTHVHMNIQDMSLEKVGDLLMVYLVMENALFRFVGRNRIRNPYCVPLYATNLLRNYVNQGVRAGWQKYAGFNLAPMPEKGTVEFRHMHGTFDVRKISIWIDLITRLKKYVMGHTTKETRAKISSLSVDNVAEFVREVFEESSEYLKYNSLDEFEFPILSAKYCLSNRTHAVALRNAVDVNNLYFTIKD